jgi:hypothetical protein
MKAPQNFAQKISRHKLTVCGMQYELGDNMGQDNKLWIYPQNPSSRNVILMEFNWEKQFYTVKVATNGVGEIFHTTLPAFDFVRTSQFLSFAAFNSWMIAKLEDFHKYFGHK